MAKIVIYFYGFFNELNSYFCFIVSEIIVNEHMCYKELYNILISKLYNFIDIYLCLGPIEFLKKDLTITNDNDVN